MPTQNITPDNIQDYELINDNIVNVETGEIVTNIYDVKFFLDQEEAKTKIKRVFKNSWKKTDSFTKVYQTPILNISIEAFGLFYFFVSYTRTSTNEVIISGDDGPTNDFLIEKFNLSKRKLIYILNELEENNLIYKETKKKKRHIYVNPIYAFNGKNLSISTYLFFCSGVGTKKRANTDKKNKRTGAKIKLL